jgi:excisionase family DNA binding protein
VCAGVHDDPEITSMSETSIFDQGNLTVRQASTFSGLGRSTLYGYMDAGRLLYVKVGAARRIPRRALIEFLEKHLVGHLPCAWP